MSNKVYGNELDIFYNEIKDNEFISFPDAKKLLQEDNNETRVFNGSIKYVYDYLIERNYSKVETPTYDINDILNAILEEWYKLIVSKEFINYRSYAHIIQDIVRGSKLNINLGVTNNLDIGNTETISREVLKKMLPDSLDTIDYSYARFVDEYTIYEQTEKNKQENLETKYHYFLLLRSALLESEFSIEDKSFIRENISLVLDYLNQYITYHNTEEPSYDDMEDDIMNEVICEDLLNNPNLTEEERTLLIEHYGFNGEYTPISALASKYGIKERTVINHIAKGLRTLRKDSSLTRIKK